MFKSQAQSDNLQAQSQKFRSLLHNIQNAYYQEQFQRNEDLQKLAHNIEKKIKINVQAQNKKKKIINEEISSIEDQLGVLLERSGVISNQVRYFTRQKSEAIQKFCQRSQKDNKENSQAINDAAYKKFSRIAHQLIKQQNSLTQQIEYGAQQIKKTKQVIENSFKIAKQKYEKSLNQLESTFKNEIEQIESIISEQSWRAEQRYYKQKSMIDLVNKQLEEVMSEETKNGKITYDCLLALIEDSCSVLSQKVLCD